MKTPPEVVMEDHLHRMRAPLLGLALLSALLALSLSIAGEFFLLTLSPTQGKILSGIEQIAPHWALNSNRRNTLILVGQLAVEYVAKSSQHVARPWVIESWKRFSYSCKEDEPLDTERPLRRALQQTLRFIDEDPNCFQVVAPPDRFRSGNLVPLLRIPILGVVVVADRMSLHLPSLVLLIVGAGFLTLFGAQMALQL